MTRSRPVHRWAVPPKLSAPATPLTLRLPLATLRGHPLNRIHQTPTGSVMRRHTARTLLVPFLALLLALLAAPPGTAHPGAAPVNHAESPAAPSAPRYAGYLFAYFTGEGTADGEQIRYALSRGNNALSWRELNGGQPVLTSTTGEKGLRDPFVIPLPRGRPVLPHRHRSQDVPEQQRQLGRGPAARQQVDHGVGVHRPGELDRPAPGGESPPTAPATPGRPRPTGTRRGTRTSSSGRRSCTRPTRKERKGGKGRRRRGKTATRDDSTVANTVAPTTATPRTSATRPPAPRARSSSPERRRRT
ncbi:hypothetical protein SHIRM173S_06928 [Streptomyces hirsutus]